MEELQLGKLFDFALIYDSLHHSARHRRALQRVAAHLKPGGWLLLGETSWLHRISPFAHRHARETGWMERGFTVRGLRADLKAGGLTEQRRFFQGTHPYESRSGEFAWQLVRLVAGNFAVAPKAAIWARAKSTKITPRSTTCTPR